VFLATMHAWALVLSGAADEAERVVATAEAGLGAGLAAAEPAAVTVPAHL
jgi:hypothetical protein